VFSTIFLFALFISCTLSAGETGGCTADNCKTGCVDCFADPCADAQCVGQGEVKCVADYCGGCNARFYNGDGVEVTESCMDCRLVDCAEPLCIEGYKSGYTDDSCCPTCVCDTVNCFAQPCEVTSCDAFPDAVCEDDYCGGCNARFYLVNEKEGTKEEVTEKCSTVDCSAVLCAMYLLECKPGFTQTTVPGTCCEYECTECSNVACFANPCEVIKRECKAFPDATCVPNYCRDSCSYDFVDSDGNSVDCGDGDVTLDATVEDVDDSDKTTITVKPAVGVKADTLSEEDIEALKQEIISEFTRAGVFDVEVTATTDSNGDVVFEAKVKSEDRQAVEDALNANPDYVMVDVEPTGDNATGIYLSMLLVVCMFTL